MITEKLKLGLKAGGWTAASIGGGIVGYKGGKTLINWSRLDWGPRILYLTMLVFGLAFLVGGAVGAYRNISALLSTDTASAAAISANTASAAKGANAALQTSSSSDALSPDKVRGNIM